MAAVAPPTDEQNDVNYVIDTGLPSKIMDQLYLGTAFHAWDDKVLQNLHITHIVCCISGASNYNTNKVKRLMIPMDDRGYSTVSEKLDKVYPFITTALKSTTNNVLIHCKSAVNRSPTITVAFMMQYKTMTLKEAHGIVSQKHELICCHHHYMDQLRELDKELFGSYSTKEDELETTKSMMAKLRQQFMMQHAKETDEKQPEDDYTSPFESPSQIMDHVYLGKLCHVSDSDLLERLKITHTVCCIADHTDEDKQKIKRLMVPMDDRGRSLINNVLEEVYDFIVNALQNDENNILIYCRSCVNRSPSVAVAFMMKYKAMTLKEAYDLVLDKHRLMCLHFKYMEQLREYDKELYGQYSTELDQLKTGKSTLQEVRDKLKSQNADL